MLSLKRWKYMNLNRHGYQLVDHYQFYCFSRVYSLLICHSENQTDFWVVFYPLKGLSFIAVKFACLYWKASLNSAGSGASRYDVLEQADLTPLPGDLFPCPQRAPRSWPSLCCLQFCLPDLAYYQSKPAVALLQAMVTAFRVFISSKTVLSAAIVVLICDAIIKKMAHKSKAALIAFRAAFCFWDFVGAQSISEACRLHHDTQECHLADNREHGRFLPVFQIVYRVLFLIWAAIHSAL